MYLNKTNRGILISECLVMYFYYWSGWHNFLFYCTALAAASSPLGVIGGTLAGHAVATLVRLQGKRES